jgi:hypothetical protein
LLAETECRWNALPAHTRLQGLRDEPQPQIAPDASNVSSGRKRKLQVIDSESDLDIDSEADDDGLHREIDSGADSEAPAEEAVEADDQMIIAAMKNSFGSVDYKTLWEGLSFKESMNEAVVVSSMIGCF